MRQQPARRLHGAVAQVSVAEDARFELLRGLHPNTLSKCAPQRSRWAAAVRDLGRPQPVGLGGRPQTQANETTNETAAGAGGLTPASPARELLLCPRRGESAR